ncbi:hypothetical protein [[Kitasatospora] papulosa]|uniref:hypothetical protein n=1 Tax=[Kitasatospora] papulosa TaxID=1464011 RepID=UPI0036B1372E
MRQRWVTGDCWLGCERTDLLVLWLGPVQWDGAHAPFLACADCLDRLKRQSCEYLLNHRPADLASLTG